MEIAENFNSEAEEIFRRWADTTLKILLRQIDKKKVKDTEKLRKSLSVKIVEIGEGFLSGEFSFMPRGRFVDMGAGRKRAFNPYESTYQKAKERKPKKWYSRPFWGRLNDLEGVMGIELMEYAVKAIKQELEDEKTG